VAKAAAFRLVTTSPVELTDVTEQVQAFVKAAGLATGWVNVQTRHTTTGVVVNENEPLLLGDLQALLERLAPRAIPYAHDALHLRAAALPDERPNGHAHAKALLLRSTESLNVADGRLQLGRWQRILFVELDGPRQRELSLVVLGEACR
jgi:secondary thiamine-phosphate synthase enzyme